jgi:hypothetical protein
VLSAYLALFGQDWFGEDWFGEDWFGEDWFGEDWFGGGCADRTASGTIWSGSASAAVVTLDSQNARMQNKILTIHKLLIQLLIRLAETRRQH